MLRVCKTPLGLNPALAGIKHLNRLEQVMARAEWDDTNIAEGLMLDVAGHVIEGTMSNVFCVRQDTLFTPDLTHCGVEGITRERVLKTAGRNGLEAVVTQLGLADIRQADEVFICNSLIGIWPVRRLAEKSWLPGPITKALKQALENSSA